MFPGVFSSVTIAAPWPKTPYAVLQRVSMSSMLRYLAGITIGFTLAMMFWAGGQSSTSQILIHHNEVNLVVAAVKRDLNLDTTELEWLPAPSSIYRGDVNFTTPTADILFNITGQAEVDAKIDDLSMNPIPFLPTYKNPCWFEALPGGSMYRENVWAKTYPREFKHFMRKMPDLMLQRKDSGFGWRLRCLPYFYIAGVTKCGTTDLYQALKRHPDVAEAPWKEPTFWNSMRRRENVPPTLLQGFKQSTKPNVEQFRQIPYPRPFSDYVDMYDMASEQIRKQYELKKSSSGEIVKYHKMITMDATPSYLHDIQGWKNWQQNVGLAEPKYTTANFIHGVTPKAKTILMLRNPTDRLYSNYKFFKNSASASPQDFHDMTVTSIRQANACLSQRTVRSCLYDKANFSRPVDVTVGMYQPHLLDWLNVFPRKNVLVLRLEDYKNEHTEALARVFNFLGLGTDYMPKDRHNSKVYNVGKVPLSLQNGMRNDTRLMIDNFYKPWNRRLASLLQDSRFTWES